MPFREIARVLLDEDEAESGPCTALDLVRRVEAGLPRDGIKRLCRTTGLGTEDIAVVIPQRSQRDPKAAKWLSRHNSDRLFRLADIVLLASRHLGSCDAAVAWLRSIHPSLDGQAPLRMLRTYAGGKLVHALLAGEPRGSAPRTDH